VLCWFYYPFQSIYWHNIECNVKVFPCRKESEELVNDIEVLMLRMQQLVADGIKTTCVILFIDGTMNLRLASPLAHCI
jgi:hypothetical protein